MARVIDIIRASEERPGLELAFDVDGRFVRCTKIDTSGHVVVVSLTEQPEPAPEPEPEPEPEPQPEQAQVEVLISE